MVALMPSYKAPFHSFFYAIGAFYCIFMVILLWDIAQGKITALTEREHHLLYKVLLSGCGVICTEYCTKDSMYNFYFNVLGFITMLLTIGKIIYAFLNIFRDVPLEPGSISDIAVSLFIMGLAYIYFLMYHAQRSTKPPSQ